MKKRKDGWKHVIYKDKVPRVYFGRIGLGMDFLRRNDRRGGRSEAARFQTSCFQQKTPCSIPICSKGSRSYNWGLALAMPRDVQSGPEWESP